MFLPFLRGGLLLACACLSASIVQADKPQRIVSLSLCADQYILGMVAPKRIAALSEEAANPRLSLQYEKAQGLRTTRGNAEEVLLLKPDLVIVNKWRHKKTTEILQQSGIPVLMLSLPVTLQQIEEETRKVAKALGEQKKTNALLSELRNAKAEAQSTKAPRAAYFMPGGYSAGKNTFVDTVLHAAGYRNLASELNMKGWSSLPLEKLVLEKPDVLVMSFFSRGKHRLSTRLRQHSALQELMKTTPVIDVPDKYWACGGWFLYEAINYLKSKGT